MTERIGFIGVGLMGHGMAKNIVEKGFPLTVLAHRKREAVDDLMGRGAHEAASPRAVAEASDVVVLCVTGSPQVEAIVLGEDGLAAAGKPLLIIDCSTSEPASTRRLAAELAPKGITFIDAPLSRTPKDAWEGTLDVMVGGEPAAVARARPILEDLRRPHRRNRAGRHGPHDEAPQQFRVDGLRGALFGGADGRRQGGLVAESFRRGDPATGGWTAPSTRPSENT